MELPDLSPANAEIWLAVASMALLILGVFLGDRGSRVVTWASVSALVVAGWIVWQGADVQMTFAGMFVADRFGAFAKVLILAGSALSLVLSLGYLAREKLARFEFPVLVLLGTLGMMVMVTANDLISLYVGLELQSLALYVLAAFNRDSVRSTESGLK